MKLLKEMPLKVAEHEIAANIFLLHNQFKKKMLFVFGCVLLLQQSRRKLLFHFEILIFYEI